MNNMFSQITKRRGITECVVNQMPQVVAKFNKMAYDEMTTGEFTRLVGVLGGKLNGYCMNHYGKVTVSGMLNNKL